MPTGPAESIIRQKIPQLKSMFVTGAPAHLTRNLNPLRGCANGTPVITHSLTFATKEQEASVTALIAVADPDEVLVCDIHSPYSSLSHC